MSIPFGEIDTVFFDVGNTLISIDFDRVSDELAQRGVAVPPQAVRRAEARARPLLSAAMARRREREGPGGFTIYLDLLLAALEPPEAGRLDDAQRRSLVDELTPVLRIPGRADLLWSWVIPGVPEALEAMRRAGLRLAVVSNADGTVEASLTARGLRAQFHAVADSHVVGFQKPDPRIFEHALKACGTEPGRTLHVGDLYAADVVGARAAGVHAVLLDPYDDWGETDCLRLPDLASLGERLIAARRGRGTAERLPNGPGA